MQSKSIESFITQNYAEYGKFTALSRAIPHIDGLKPVQRRVIYALKDTKDLIGSVDALGRISKYHPFGNMALYDTIALMARVGAIKGHGGFGVKLLEEVAAAAERYTSVGLTESQQDMYLGLVDFVPMVDGEEVEEPEYLPLPIPYALIYGSFTLTMGYAGRIPAFTEESIIDAYVNDSPTKLKSKFGYNIDYANSDLLGLWSSGYGNISYSMDVIRDGEVIDIIGSGELFSPNLSELLSLVDQGQILISNLSKDKIHLQITRKPRARNVNMDDVYHTCLQAAKYSTTFDLSIVHNNQVRRVGMRYWIDHTLNKFMELYNSKLDKVDEDIKFQMDVLTNLPEIGKLVLKGLSKSEIHEKMIYLTSAEVINNCLGRSISNLLKDDHTKAIENLKIKKSNNDKLREVFSTIIGTIEYVKGLI